MGFLGKLIADVVETTIDTVELGASVVVDTVTLPFDVITDEETFVKTKDKAQEMKNKD